MTKQGGVAEDRVIFHQAGQFADILRHTRISLNPLIQGCDGSVQLVHLGDQALQILASRQNRIAAP